MPEIGETKTGKEIGRASLTQKYTWVACETCGRPRWVPYINGHPAHKQCKDCSRKRTGEESANWKGGKGTVTKRGYIRLYINPNDFFYPMASPDNRIPEHRLVMAKHLGRCLHSWEIVHHEHTLFPQGSDEDRGDNRPENLRLVSVDEHKQITILETKLNKRIHELQFRVTMLEAENVLLHEQVRGQSAASVL